MCHLIDKWSWRLTQFPHQNSSSLNQKVGKSSYWDLTTVESVPFSNACITHCLLQGGLMAKFRILAQMSKVFPEWMPILVNRLTSSISNRISDLLDWQVHVARIRAAYLQINSSLESSYPPCFVPLSKPHDDISHIHVMQSTVASIPP